MRNNYKLKSRILHYSALGIFSIGLLLGSTDPTYAIDDRNITISEILMMNKAATTNASFQANLSKSQITIEVKGVSFVDFFNLLKTKSGQDLYLSYNAADIKSLGSITVNEKNTTVEQILTNVLTPAGLTYSIKGNIVSIKKIETQQKIAVKGKVIDVATNKPIAGAMILIEGTQIGAIADAKGDFILNTTKKNGTIVVTCVGYQECKSAFKEGESLQIKMKADVMKVDEVTVVAYGAQKTRNVLGAITSVKAKDLEEIPSASLENLLQGHMAGVEVTNVSGSPGGGGTKVQIRGYNSLMDGGTDGSPLYVIDGVPVSSFTSPITGTNTLSEIDPSTIESIEVLKDAASAAIYGSRASNGVILITTKKGKSGRGKFSVNFSQSYSILPETPEQLIGNAERQLHLMAARAERAGYSSFGKYTMPGSYEEIFGKFDGAYDYFWGTGRPRPIGDDRILQDSLNPFYNNSTNWWKYCFRPGLITNVNVQTSGGTDLIQYMVGGGYYGERGIMLGSDFKRMNLISNLSITPRKNFKVDARIYLAYTDRSKGAAGGAKEIEGLTVDPKANSSMLPGGGEIEKKTLEKINETLEKNNSLRLRSSIAGSYTVFNGLTLSSTVAVDYTSAKKYGFIPSYLDPIDKLSESSASTSATTMLTNENMINYNKVFGDVHSVDVLFGHSFMRQTQDGLSGSGRGGPSDKLHYVVEGFPDLIEINGQMKPMKSFLSDFQEQVMISYFGRFSYNYKQKYLAEITVRRDGSSVFGENVRWATFPSAALGWTFSEEKFMKNLYWLDFAKIRTSYGKSGQSFKNPYLAHGILGLGSSFIGYPGMEPLQVLNANLTWEETDQYDLGLDFYLFEQRLKVKADYYYKYSKSLLWNVPLPGNVYGHNKALQNVMEISNQGFELEFNYDIFRESEVKWRTKFNISSNSNRFEKSYTDMDMSHSGGMLVLGRPIHSLYLYNDNGIYQSKEEVPISYDTQGNMNPLYSGSKAYPYAPGMRRIEDINMDGKINDDDRIYAASTLPAAFGGWANEVKWRNFDLNVLFTYTLGQHMINGYVEPSLKLEKGRWNPVFGDYRNEVIWNNPGDNAKYPTMLGSSYAGQYDAMYKSKVEKVNYVRLKQLTLGYNIPKKVMSKIGIEGIRVFFTAENLFLLTNYSGVDPETVNPQTGFDSYENYPLARKMTLGLSVNF